MFNGPEETPSEYSRDPAARAMEKADEFRVHAQLAAVFEGTRKFEAGIYPGLDAALARDVQKTMGSLEKGKMGETPVLGEKFEADALRLLNLPEMHELSTNDYHIHRRPGEVMILRWLAGEQVQTFYERLQAHFDAAMEGYRDDERQEQEWKKDAATLAYLKALDEIKISMEERYLREVIRKHNVFVLSTQTADELNIAYLADHIMQVPAEEIVGAARAPAEGASEQDLAWFFKLYALRGMSEGIERMCFFAYLQKSDDSAW